MVEQEPNPDDKIPKNTKYTSSILKFKANSKIKNNAAVATMTQNNIPTLEDMAEILTKTRSMQDEDFSDPLKDNQVIKTKTIIEAKQEYELGKSPTLPGIDDLLVDSEGGSETSSFVEDVGEDIFAKSIMQTTQIKEPEDLIDKDLLNMMNFIKKMKPPNEEEIQTKSVEFGELTRTKTCIFDLDETLIHSKIIQAGQDPPANCTFTIELPNGGKFAIFKRPYVEKILEHLTELWEIAIFTAAEKTYADLILDNLDPQKKYFRHRLYRDHCFRSEDGVYVKDLRIIADRELEEMVIIDNCILSFSY